MLRASDGQVPPVNYPLKLQSPSNAPRQTTPGQTPPPWTAIFTNTLANVWTISIVNNKKNVTV